MTDILFFVNQKQNFGEMTRDKIEEMFKIVGTHVAKIKRAN